MSAVIEWDGASNVVMLGDRAVTVASVVSNGEGWTATVRLTEGVDMTLTALEGAVERALVAFWQRPAEHAVGVAIVADQGRPMGVAAIPVCECGEPSCANAGRQLDASVDATGPRELIDLVSRLPRLRALERDHATWHPDHPHSGRAGR